MERLNRKNVLINKVLQWITLSTFLKNFSSKLVNIYMT